jgi:HSP20 family protein
MPGLIIWKDQEIGKLKKDIDRLFLRLCNDFGMNILPRNFMDYPAFEQSETEDYLIFNVDIPGVDPENLDISITEDFLSIKGESAHESINQGETNSRLGRRVSSFSRSVQLSCRVKVDDVRATYKEGILTIVMPKQGPEISHAFKIKVK